MPRDPLDAVLRIRKATVDEARRALATAMRSEGDARAAALAADEMITKEGEIASDLSSGDGAVEAFGRWLPHGRALAAAAHGAHRTADANVGVCRAALNAAKAAAEAASNLLDRRAAERAAEAARKAQQEMDEIASRRREPTSL